MTINNYIDNDNDNDTLQYAQIVEESIVKSGRIYLILNLALGPQNNL